MLSLIKANYAFIVLVHVILILISTTSVVLWFLKGSRKITEKNDQEQPAVQHVRSKTKDGQKKKKPKSKPPVEEEEQDDSSVDQEEHKETKEELALRVWDQN